MWTGDDMMYFVNRSVILAPMEPGSTDNLMISAREVGEDRRKKGES